MAFKKGTIKLATANTIFANTNIQFEAVDFAGKVAGWRTTENSPIKKEHVNLIECVQSVIDEIFSNL